MTRYSDPLMDPSVQGCINTYRNCYGLWGLYLRHVLDYNPGTGELFWQESVRGRGGHKVGKHIMIAGRHRNPIGVIHLWMTNLIPNGPIEPANGCAQDLMWWNIKHCPNGYIDPPWHKMALPIHVHIRPPNEPPSPF